jgi:hypothetical protein
VPNNRQNRSDCLSQTLSKRPNLPGFSRLRVSPDIRNLDRCINSRRHIGVLKTTGAQNENVGFATAQLIGSLTPPASKVRTARNPRVPG